MKGNELLDAMGGIDEKYIAEASEPKRKRFPWEAVVACAALVILGSVVIPKIPRPTTGAVERDESTHLTETAVTTDVPTESVKKGLQIPAVELPKSTDGTKADMIGLVVYRGNIYTQGFDIQENAPNLVGEYIGMATGSIDEWSTQEDYAEELASTVSGKVYTVKGYDPAFRICLHWDDGRTEFMEHLNGITLENGADVFEERLKIRGNVAKMFSQTHDDWNECVGNFHDVQMDDALWDAFLEQIDSAEFQNLWDETAMKAGEPSVYDMENQAHLFLTMQDGTTVHLRLMEDGYVGYQSLGWYFVQIPGETFDTVFGMVK